MLRWKVSSLQKKINIPDTCISTSTINLSKHVFCLTACTERHLNGAFNGYLFLFFNVQFVPIIYVMFWQGNARKDNILVHFIYLCLFNGHLICQSLHDTVRLTYQPIWKILAPVKRAWRKEKRLDTRLEYSWSTSFAIAKCKFRGKYPHIVEKI